MIPPKSLVFLLLGITCRALAQNLNPSDSILVKKYWDKIHITSITSKSGDLYAGINNYLELRLTEGEYAPANLILETNNGSIEWMDNKVITVPKYAGNSFIKIYMVNIDRDTVLVGKQRLIVHRIPDPSLKIGETIIEDQSSVDRKVFFLGDSLRLYFTDDLPESSRWYHIDYFNAGFTYGGAYFHEDNEGPIFSKRSLEIIKNQLPGHEFIIKVISVSPNVSHFHVLPIIRFRMI